jgi:hypothetical protein
VVAINESPVVPAERIQSRIIVLRGQRVLLDADLAAIYEVPTKRLIEQMKRNEAKFPEDFAFQLSAEEMAAARQQTPPPKPGRGGRRYLPYASTEHGAIQAANILRSDAAIQMSVQVVRAFVQLRQLVVNHKAIAAKLAELDARIGAHDDQLAAIVEALRQLAEPVLPANRRRIGFNQA